MDLLKRKLAPITSEAWEQIDEEAKRVLELHLAGRKLVDFSGPHGWKLGSVQSGRLAHIVDAPVEHVGHAVRVVHPIVELRSAIVLPILELDYAARGAHDLNLDPVIETAKRIAHAEDGAIFHGFKPGGIEGIIPASPHTPVSVPTAASWVKAIEQGLEVLRIAGVDGPYALVAGPDAFDELVSATEDGYPLRKRAESLVGSPLVWGPAIKGGAVLMSTRGGDYELTVGQDMSIGYTAADRTNVELYLTETFTFRIHEDKAAIFLRRA